MDNIKLGFALEMNGNRPLTLKIDSMSGQQCILECLAPRTFVENITRLSMFYSFLVMYFNETIIYKSSYEHLNQLCHILLTLCVENCLPTVRIALSCKLKCHSQVLSCLPKIFLLTLTRINLKKNGSNLRNLKSIVSFYMRFIKEFNTITTYITECLKLGIVQ